MNNKARPGVMIYFDKILPARERLSNESLGTLINGILNYVLYGEIPQLDDLAGMAFDIMRPGLDADGIKYAEECERRSIHGRYMAYCKQYSSRGETPPLSEEEFKQELLATDSNSQLLNINRNLTQTQELNLTRNQNLSLQRAGEEKGEIENCKGEKGGGLLMPGYVPLSESEEQDRRSAAIRALENYPDK